jgi:pimeloyl-ACP methyl ester carboxylesterase
MMRQGTATAQKARSREDTIALLRGFVVDELLDGNDEGLDAKTPLLQWGVIDSLAMVTLLAFIEERLGVHVPDEEVRPEHFQNLATLSELLERLATTRADGAGEARAATATAVRSERLEIEGGGSLRLLRTPPQRERPTWLVLPSLGAVASSWDVFLRNLRGDQEAVALDWPGFGQSTWPTPELRFEEQRAAALALLDALATERNEPVVIVGHAIGALIGLELLRERPERVKALVAIGYGQIADTDDEADAWWHAYRAHTSDAGVLLERGFHQPLRLRDGARRTLDEALAAPAYRDFWDDAASESAARGFGGLPAVPTLFVAGEADRLVPRTAVEAAAARVPQARVEWLARSGHFVPVERPQELLMLINLFLYGRSK